MWALCVLLASLTVVHAGAIADYLAEVGLGPHGTNFEQALALSEWKNHDLDGLQSMEAYELGELCSEAEMSTKEAIRAQRAAGIVEQREGAPNGAKLRWRRRLDGARRRRSR